MTIPKLRLAPAFEMLGEPPVPLIKERPVQKGAIRHQSPLNTGLRFAAKASKARRQSFVAVQIAWACASISLAVSTLTAHSVLSCVLVMPWAEEGPLARMRAGNPASSSKARKSVVSGKSGTGQFELGC